MVRVYFTVYFPQQHRNWKNKLKKHVSSHWIITSGLTLARPFDGSFSWQITLIKDTSVEALVLCMVAHWHDLLAHLNAAEPSLLLFITLRHLLISQVKWSASSTDYTHCCEVGWVAAAADTLWAFNLCHHTCASLLKKQTQKNINNK